jgi:hypothetical protein
MNASARFAEVGRLLAQDEEIRTVAEQVVGVLEGQDAGHLVRVAADADERDGFYQQLWDQVVEPLRHDAASTLDMWRMSMEGVVIDHLIALWATEDGHDWRSRLRGLLALQPV